MGLLLKDSKTKANLMKAFAGESQARNRYTFAAVKANNEKLYVLEWVFKYTANQELAHANIYYNHLKELSGDNISIEASYPVDIYDTLDKLLKSAQHNEYQEHDVDYANFAKIAHEEGFSQIASSFELIAKVEKVHGDRFGAFADAYINGKLFKCDTEVEWYCSNCGHVHKGKQAPMNCPVCSHPQGYFMRFDLTPFQK